MIFICTFDPCGQGRHIYRFENRCKEDLSLALGDKSKKIFINTKGVLPDAVVELLGELGQVPEALRKEICEQQDTELLTKWLKLAAKADTIENFERLWK